MSKKLRQEGTIISASDQTMWGFIRPQGGRDYYFHFNDIVNKDALLQGGRYSIVSRIMHKVTFLPSPHRRKGKAPKAIDVQILN